MYLARVYVTLKPAVNDPQGNTVLSALKLLGFAGVIGVRVGKYLELSLEAADKAAAEAQVAEACKRLLANPVIEDYRFQVEELASATAKP
ncbi:MAG: phosphoribosylformylglycinamidine synthase subunit PurS [Chloroflexi bacterium]|nr:phosphoribosylformylglycinamidine synthase subunit PurS [Chloroflexota bacterium]